MSAGFRLPKKFREICYELMDGSYESIEKLDAFENKFPHQVMAVKAAIAFFDKDYEKAIDLVEGIMPYWSEWYYSNVVTEYVAAMVFASKEIGQEERVRKIIKDEQERLSSDCETSDTIKKSRNGYFDFMLNYLDTGVMPKTEGEMEYSVPSDVKSVDEIMASEKLKGDTVKEKIKLFKMVCWYGKPEDALEIYEEIKDEDLSEMDHENAIIRYLYLKNDEKALEAIERLATARFWTVAAPTQIRPMNFFTHPMMHKFLRDEDALERIKKAAFIDDGKLKRK